MEQPVPRQTLIDPDFYTDEYGWLTSNDKGYPSVFPMMPMSGWSDITTTVSVSSAVAYESETVYEIDKTLKLYPSVGNALNGKYTRTDTISAGDEYIPALSGTFRVTVSDSATVFVPNS